MAVLVYKNGVAVDIVDPEKILVQSHTLDANGNVVARAWLQPSEIRLRVGGVWLSVWPKPFADINDYQVNGGGLAAGYRINADGNAEWAAHTAGQPFPTYRYGVIEQWLKKGSANQFVVKAEKDSNPAYVNPTGSPLDQWLDASSSPQWNVEESGAISLLTVRIGRIDGAGGGNAITDDAGVELQTSDGATLLDSTISVTEMDSAAIVLNNWNG